MTKDINKAFADYSRRRDEGRDYGKLIKKYRWMFDIEDKDRRLPFTLFGFECGDGWYKLLAELCRKIDEHAKKNPDIKKDFRVLQVKEKFGTLRFYATVGDKKIDEWIEEAEETSGRICEVCGAVGEMRTIGGWYMTLCDKCMEKRE